MPATIVPDVGVEGYALRSTDCRTGSDPASGVYAHGVPRYDTGFLSEADMLISLRADRYFAGLCVSCGREAATEPMHPLMENALTASEFRSTMTHCRSCALVAMRLQDKAQKRGEAANSMFLFMLLKG